MSYRWHKSHRVVGWNPRWGPRPEGAVDFCTECLATKRKQPASRPCSPAPAESHALRQAVRKELERHGGQGVVSEGQASQKA